MLLSKISKKLFLFFGALSPALVFAVETPQDFKGFLGLFIGIIQLLIPVIGAISLWMFFKGLIVFIKRSGNENEYKEGRQLMIWGVIILFVMVSVYAILNIFYGSVFGGRIGIPQLP
ncbi:MAG TPA: hypothetical protein VJJ27_01240 [Candidatus Paceibacterota bacterium]